MGPKKIDAIESSKEALTKAPVLHLPQWEWLFCIKTDESGVDLGAALSNLGSQYCLSLMCALGTLHDAYRRYSATKREGMLCLGHQSFQGIRCEDAISRSD